MGFLTCFLNDFFFQFDFLTFCWLRVTFYLFQFALYEFILILWFEQWVWLVDLVDSSHLLLFFYFILQHWVNWELDFTICFSVLFIKLSRSYNLSHRFRRLTQVNFCYFLLFFFQFHLSILRIEIYNLFWRDYNCFMILLKDLSD